MKELEITAAEWKKYKDKLRRISEKAADQMQAYAEAHHFQMDQAMIDYAYALSTKYGEASAALACDMYDELAAYWHADVPSAVPANTATYGEVAKAMYGSMKQSPDGKLISSVADRLVKQAGADTTIKNAIRDGAYWAWIPTGDTCAFCLTLASRGWQKASKKVLRGDHAEHIHAHCDCTFAIAFRPSDTEKYPFYDPDKYYLQYLDANGNINEMRKKMYPDIAEARNARRRELYELQQHILGKKVDVTEQAITKVKQIVPKGTSQDEAKNLQEMNKAILRFSKDNNQSNEVAMIYKDGNTSSPVAGEQRQVDILSNPEVAHALRSSELRSITLSHNHPGLSYFSYDDLGVFVQYPSIRTIMLVTNQGKVAYLTKTEKYEDVKMVELYNNIGKRFNGKKESETVEAFLAEAYNSIERSKW